MKKLLFFLILTQSLFAQKVNLKINVYDNFQNPVIGATVILKQKKATDFQLSNFTDTTGLVNFKIDQEGLYLLKISYVGFQNIEKEIEVNPKNSFFSFELKESSNSLDEVTIVAKKPFMRQEDDKTIIDPEPIANTSTNALELLEKTPGLFVDPDGNVYLNSTTPASIYINGREQKMSATDVSNILKSLPPNSIEKIEVIRTPSASMDAGSTGGSVNIVLRKGVKLGRTGSVTGGMNQGQLGNQFVSLNINRRLFNHVI